MLFFSARNLSVIEIRTCNCNFFQLEPAFQEAQYEPAAVLAQAPQAAPHVTVSHDERNGAGRRCSGYARWPRCCCLGPRGRTGRAHWHEHGQPQVDTVLQYLEPSLFTVFHMIKYLEVGMQL
jgi:hypothetical protein